VCTALLLETVEFDDDYDSEQRTNFAKAIEAGKVGVQPSIKGPMQTGI
jgi:hypothetical protein